MDTDLDADGDAGSADGPDTVPFKVRKGTGPYRFVRGAVGARMRLVSALRDPDRFIQESLDELHERHPFLAWLWSLLHLDFAGLFVGGVFLELSFTVSLLPRGWFFQGFIAGINAVIGYGVGAFAKWLITDLLVRGHPIRTRPRLARLIPFLRAAIVLINLAGVAIMLVISRRWQADMRALMGQPAEHGYWWLLIPAIAFVTSVLLISVFRALRDLARLLAKEGNRYLRIPPAAARILGACLVVLLVILVFDGVVFRAFRTVANSIASTSNDATRAGMRQPMEFERSGSPDSAASWSGLGYEGRNFVAGGLRKADIERFTDHPVTEPVRVYVGLENASTPEQRKAIMLRELQRTGALDRKYLVVIPTTGSGWVNPTAARALELMYDGDVALVAAQYSYLPSWISFVTDGQLSLEAGKRLIDTVHTAVDARPQAQRPKLLVMGESLGTRAGEGAFDSLAQIREEVDGVVWIGPPAANPIHGALTQRRDLGTPEVLPTYSDGLVVRFTDGVKPLTGGPEWLEPRIVYVQHASDPVVWWSPDLLLREPDWLREPPGRDRSRAMAWYPFVTFWQVSADLANAAGVPDGHGHNYGTAVVDAFAAVMPPAGWTPADTERVRVATMASAALDGAEK
ncbi:alpha/beta hydrolase [Tsukamurella sp. 8F]|uniref:alpha/beta hydrolase n=1 Tax=unclassified Tsukamurella TaxID=2633480 RepID=UPI0023B94916|nr:MULTISPECIES: alpha/beta hydrolase [unclassified Tsukamurella]MDF0530533.1 alpha/beta hydrolase [Tsukamurella sp. 8J]MDF0586817.1 alpha/beta hydrolase [Tsukamurella sp. 8F]